MKHAVVRITNLNLKNFKNVEWGDISFGKLENLEQRKGDICGLYGQNGSGKTAAIDALSLLQKLLLGNGLPDRAEEYIYKGKESAQVEVEFVVCGENFKYIFWYEYTLRFIDNKCRVYEEKLSYKDIKNNSHKKNAFYCSLFDGNDKYGPDNAYRKFIDNSNQRVVEFAVAKKMAANNGTSLLFSEDGYKIFSGNYMDETVSIGVKEIKYFARMKMFVITNKDNGIINMQFLIPINITRKNVHKIDKGIIPVSLQETSVIPLKMYEALVPSLKAINKVLEAIVPNMRVEVEDYGKQLLNDGMEGHKIELVSSRGTVRVPLRCESAGVIKIVSLLNAMVALYTDEAICLIVDELDSGIFEYLLGNLLQVLYKNCKGQLFFTSHNLRILETIGKESIKFTTVNPKRRYVSLVNVKETNNVRDTYLRSLSIGGQKEKLCEDIDIYSINRAFRMAGKDLSI
ncbi:ATP-binding protein [Selenomonas ruminis]|uniref:AAA family ATPase n=1 Tax=Selenomonas ruminis TaxID=2593411 RepID=A0A5D6W844_9FIRM|nr:ATP-binding protein [Selenomonas sp. mPRGC5]TYZ24137.1 AAA family ATPase [Selenomonas sp. mPRGC5]